MNALLQEALKGAEELADQQTRQLLIEATSSQRIQELAAELQDAKVLSIFADPKEKENACI